MQKLHVRKKKGAKRKKKKQPKLCIPHDPAAFRILLAVNKTWSNCSMKDTEFFTSL